jgi:hypothetical protein
MAVQGIVFVVAPTVRAQVDSQGPAVNERKDAGFGGTDPHEHEGGGGTAVHGFGVLDHFRQPCVGQLLNGVAVLDGKTQHETMHVGQH